MHHEGETDARGGQGGSPPSSPEHPGGANSDDYSTASE